jgi:tight adherence protein B
MSAGLLFQVGAFRLRRKDRGRFQIFFSPTSAPRVEERATLSLPVSLKRKLDRAGLHPSRRQLSSLAVAAAVIIILAMAIAGALAGFLVAISLAVAMWAALEWRIAQRHKAISDCMLGFLERMRQLLLVGNSLARALGRAADNSPAIIMEVIAPALRRIDNGSGVAESLERCAIDLELYEMHLLATAARTNLRFGGSMTIILRNMIENMHRRAAIERELRANTTQIRSSAWVLGLLPVFISTLVMLTSPGYAHWFLANPSGHLMLLYALVSQLAGACCMRLIIRTRY